MDIHYARLIVNDLSLGIHHIDGKHALAMVLVDQEERLESLEAWQRAEEERAELEHERKLEGS